MLFSIKVFSLGFGFFFFSMEGIGGSITPTISLAPACWETMSHWYKYCQTV